MKKKYIPLVLLGSCLLPMLAAANIVYVSAAATGTNNGTSWANAFTTIQSGLAAAIPGDEVWVKAGVYRPTTTTNRGASFTLSSGIALIGGFAGTETLLSQRNITLNQTVLSGDIGTQGTATDNVYHVVTANNVSTGTILDGFKIVSGYASESIIADEGGGFYNKNGSPTIRNCTFQNNFALQAGGAISHTISGNITIQNCTIKSNNTNGQGGGIELRTGIKNIP
jgi:hypothetical protein